MMLDFITSNKAYFSITVVWVLACFVGSMCAIIYQRWTIDRGLTVKDGRALLWNKSNLPISVVLSEQFPPKYQVEMRSSLSTFNKIGQPLLIFDYGSDTYGLDPTKRMPPGFVYIDIKPASGFMQSDQAITDLGYSDLTGEVFSATVTFPDELNGHRLRTVFLHELMHVLGFADSLDKESIMYETIQDRPQEMTEKDVRLLRKHYSATT